ncbi:SRPBCC family protein [Halogeometricum limi]|uniref:Ligand-binding SRPBCC domain-containing protein n=1 Tax=Halogeometricum limi TaxID=555875 RepID=A0A1I6IS10_9EURY|nr:SRPBCC family protein [Halogeometricum limi]SFR69421.1 Ligand-binding SRPBCC domain-containing protein [Halogeometricum limi]
MATYTRRTRVAAPLSEVWKFHSKVSGLEALTPEWMGLDVVSVRGPNGEPDPEILDVGAEIRMSLHPLGVGPKQEWTSHIVARESDGHTAMFRDEMRGGPFQKWVHTHRFYGDGEETLVEDHVEYELPGGELGRALSPLGFVGFEPMFRQRHAKTRALLE